MTRYYALHERSERMEYIGRRNPWSERATGIIKQYFYPCEYNDNQLTEIPIRRTYLHHRRKAQAAEGQHTARSEWRVLYGDIRLLWRKQEQGKGVQ